ncbi:MAG: right-handed parallel beta-helix repeat-containing protein [Pirellulales bacterium]
MNRTLFARLFSRATSAQNIRRRAVRKLAAESLEMRRVLAVTALFDGVNTLNVSLSGSGDHAYISYDGANIDIGTSEGGNDVYNGSDAITSVLIADTAAAASQQVTFSGANAIPATITAVAVLGVETANVNQVISSASVTGNASTVHVTAPGQIQDGIGLAASGATVNVSAGTFAENVVLNKQLTLRGAQFGVDARGRVVGAPNPAVETVVSPLTNMALELITGSGASTISGFSFVASHNGTSGVVGNTSGTNDGLLFEDNYVAVASGFTTSALFMNRPAVNATFDSNVFVAASGSSQAILLDGADAFHGLYFTNNNVLRSGAVGGTGFVVDGNRNVSNTGGARNPLVQGNRFEGHSLGFNGGTRAFENAQIIENTFHGNQGGLGSSAKNSLIARNTFTSNEFYGLRLTNFGSGLTDPLRGAQGTIVENNVFSNNGFTVSAAGYGDLRIDNQADGLQSTNTIRHNSFGSTVGVWVNETSGETISASSNWWGTTSDSAVNARFLGVGAATVDRTPFLGTGVDADLVTPGFQPSFNILHVTSGGAQTGSTGRIQEAIDLVTASGTVHVGPGTFNESATVNKSIQLLGAQQGVDGRSGGRTGLPSTESVVRGDDLGGSRKTAFTVSANDVVIDGFTVQDISSTNVFGTAIYMQPGTNGTEVRNNIIQNNLTGVFVSNNSSSNQTVISQNLFKDNTLAGPASGHDIYVDEYTGGVGVQNVLIDANKFTNTTMTVSAWALGLSNTHTTPFSKFVFSNNEVLNHGRGLYAYNTDDLVIQGNVITGTTNYAIGLFAALGSDNNANVDILGNTLSGNNRGVYVDGYTGALDVSGNSITSGNIAFDINDSSGFSSLNFTNNTVTGNTTGGTIANVTNLNLDANNGANSVRLNVDGSGLISVGQFSIDSQVQSIAYSNVTTFDVDALDGDDTVHVAPHPTTVIDLDGGSPATPPGDTLNYYSDGVNAFSINPTNITTATQAVINYGAFETINVSGNLLLDGTGLDDILTVTATNANSGSYVLNVNGVDNPTVNFSNVTKLTFNGLAGNDKLIINNPGGGVFAPSLGIVFNGGADSDSLDILGGSAASGAYSPGPAFDAGTLVQTNAPHTQTVNFTGVENGIAHTTTVTAFTINATTGNDILNVVNGPTVSGDQTVEVNFNGAFEEIRIANKSTATVLAGNGADTFNVNYTAAPTGISTLTLNGGSTGSTFNVQASTPAGLATNLVGGAAADLFVFSNGVLLTGNADGQGGSDTLDLSANSTARTVNVASVGAVDGFSGSSNNATAFSNIELVTGGTASDTVQQDMAVPTSWNLSGTNAGTLQASSRSLQFTSVENLVGSTTANDTFLWAPASSISGSLNARGGNDSLDYSIYNAAISVDLSAGTAANIGGGIVADGTGSSIENLYGSNQADTLVGDVDGNLIRGNDGADVMNAKGGIDDVDGNAGDDDIQVAGTEAEFDLIQGGAGVDQIYNVGGGSVTLNGFNAAFDQWINGIEEYLGAGQSLLGNLGTNGLHFGFTALTDTPTLNSGANNDSVTTSYNNSVLTAYDGDAGTDQVTLVFTPTQFDALTTADILAVQSYVASPTGQTLTVTNTPAKGNFTATNFESAKVAVNDDGLVLDITTCFAQILTDAQIVVGGDGTDDTLTGTSAVDLIFGQGGNDTIHGLEMGDCLFGGAGNDVINGNSGNDLISGGSGNDTLNGQSDNDSIFGGLGDDSLIGDLGFDVLQGNAGNDTLDGGLHDDVMNGGAGNDTLLGGDGYDQFQVVGAEAEYDVMNGGNNTDTVVNIGGSAVTLNGFLSGSNSLEGWNGAGFAIQGNSLNNTFNFQLLSLSGVPFIDGGAGDDHITGTNGVDDLRGGAGNDTIFGLGGTDTIFGGADNDSLNGGDGIDNLYGEDGVDTITTGAGRDIVFFAGDVGSEDVITDFAIYSDTINLVAYGVTYANLSFAVASPNTTINVAPSNKKIKLLNWTRVVGSSQFRFV